MKSMYTNAAVTLYTCKPPVESIHPSITNEYGPDRPPMNDDASNNPPLPPYQSRGERETKLCPAQNSEELVRGGGVERVDEVGEHQRDDHQQVRDALVDRRSCTNRTDEGFFQGNCLAGTNSIRECSVLCTVLR
jgi:hypothetical protein